MQGFINLQKEMPLAMQLPLQRLAARHGGPHGIRIPQSGRFHESGSKLKLPEVGEICCLIPTNAPAAGTEPTAMKTR